MAAKTWMVVALGCVCITGCTSARTSNTARTGKEQLLISNSVDRALEKVDFQQFGGRRVFVDEKYLDSVDKNYIAGSLRHRVLASGAELAKSADDSDIVLEVRSGGVGTDSAETYLGVPEIALPGPLPLAIPEIRMVSRSSQFGTAKIGLIAYEAKTGRLMNGGVTLARSDDNNWYVMGVGPFQNGSLSNELAQSDAKTLSWSTPFTEIASGKDDEELRGDEPPVLQFSTSPDETPLR